MESSESKLELRLKRWLQLWWQEDPQQSNAMLEEELSVLSVKDIAETLFSAWLSKQTWAEATPADSTDKIIRRCIANLHLDIATNFTKKVTKLQSFIVTNDLWKKIIGL